MCQPPPNSETQTLWSRPAPRFEDRGFDLFDTHLRLAASGMISPLDAPIPSGQIQPGDAVFMSLKPRITAETAALGRTGPSSSDGSRADAILSLRSTGRRQMRFREWSRFGEFRA